MTKVSEILDNFPKRIIDVKSITSQGISEDNAVQMIKFADKDNDGSVDN